MIATLRETLTTMPLSYLLAISLAAAIVLLQMRYAVHKSRPILLILTLVFVADLVIPGFTITNYREDYSHRFWLDDSYIIMAAFYAVLALLMVSWGYARGPVAEPADGQA